MRVYELSKQLGISNKDAVKLLQEKGFDVASHMSVLSPEAINFLSGLGQKKEQEPPAKKEVPKAPTVHPSEKEQKISDTKPSVVERKIERLPEEEPEFEEEEKPAGTITAEPMLVGEFAQKVKRPVSEIIVTLLKRGVIYAKNQVIPLSVVEQLAKTYGYELVEPKKKEARHEKVAIGSSLGQERIPVVVVIGHVDHGKTTLLDYIRKTRVAAKEKGGITQHLGAYEVKTSHGDIVFLDTPGHEAFTKMRARGVRIADIAILVVAADDGVKPQTVEAIKHAQSVNVPIIVALNKIDKVTPVQIEAAKRSLVQYGLVPEEWGGQTLVIPISAKVGTGVDKLLEMILLQAQLMELRAQKTGPAQGFVLESKLEKGFGPVATIIGQEGSLHIGDYFIAGTVTGRISSILNSQGHRLIEVGPSVPVKVAGFDQLPDAGDFFKIVSQDEYKKARAQKGKLAIPVEQKHVSVQGDVVRIIVKADNNSSKEALIEAIGKFSEQRNVKPIHVIHSAVGDINESDVVMAADTKSIIYGFHVKVDPKAVVSAQRLRVLIELYYIIYKLLDDLAAKIERAPETSYVSTKVGEATVLCMFKIKNVGIIAGAKVIDGKLVRDGKAIVKRGRQKVAEGFIKSLEREKRTVKEVHAGFECAFLVEGFQDWQVDDRVECFVEVPATKV
jgi:translation initiation factor IF-2